MKLVGQLVIVANRSLQLVYLIPRFGSAGMRSLLLLTILTQRQVISDNLLIRPIQIIR